eukprot:TRINITY_DN62332_c0_g1_i1.p1 TRINITY_DN62332_c0_g1~~TRINITY_DN62332_c0_g1_i1.p1  ORF type:complete len:685 (-),score=69.17 TRINITY_DN62332_c0_g1_i1:144-2198(-)
MLGQSQETPSRQPRPGWGFGLGDSLCRCRRRYRRQDHHRTAECVMDSIAGAAIAEACACRQVSPSIDAVVAASTPLSTTAKAAGDVAPCNSRFSPLAWSRTTTASATMVCLASLPRLACASQAADEHARQEKEGVVLGALRSSSVAGFPIQTVDGETEQGRAAIGSLVQETLPDGLYFQTPEENRATCEEATLAGFPSSALRRDAAVPRHLLTAWVRDIAEVRNTVAMCPQLVMRALLLYVEQSIAEPYGADMVEAARVHTQYSLVKMWTQERALFAVGPWAEASAGWAFDEVEARIFSAYRRTLARSWNAGSADVSNEGGKDGITSGVTLEELNAGCPQLASSGLIRGVLAGGDGEPILQTSAVVEGPSPVDMKLLGNALSLYWQARGLAYLAGVAFATSSGFAESHFVRHLPRTVPAPLSSAMATLSHGNLSRSRLLSRSCAACPGWAEWRWPHICLGPWTQIVGHIRADTRRALQLSGAESRVRAWLRPRDVVLHLRCFPFFNDGYPLAAFSFYEAVAAHWNASAVGIRFVLVAGALGPSCLDMARALERFLRKRHPSAEFIRRYNSTDQRGVLSEDLAGVVGDDLAEEDFALLALAPVLVRAMGSFSLWAALARDEGPSGLVLSFPNLLEEVGGEARWATADFGPYWHWIRAPLLSSSVVATHGFIFEESEPWVKWLETH